MKQGEKNDERRAKPKATWIQLSKDKKKGIVYEIGVPEDFPPPQQHYPENQS